MYNIYTILILNAKKFMIRNSSIMSSLLNKTLILVYVCTNSSVDEGNPPLCVLRPCIRAYVCMIVLACVCVCVCVWQRAKHGNTSAKWQDVTEVCNVEDSLLLQNQTYLYKLHSLSRGRWPRDSSMSFVASSHHLWLFGAYESNLSYYKRFPSPSSCTL